MNIIWLRPDGGVSVTTLLREDIDPEEHATDLQDRGDIPLDYIVKATNIELPVDKVFREAWSWDTETPLIDIDLSKAKQIIHARRRTKRASSFKPHDEVIALNIPGSDSVAAEEARQTIRDTDALLQVDIDACSSESDLRDVVTNSGI